MNIIALIDYKDNFGSKHNAKPYNSGMNKELLQKYFNQFEAEIEFIPFSEVITYPLFFWANKYVIYTSSEDTGYFYKSYIEDIIYYLELNGARVIPSYKYLRANNNKVFMELLRISFNSDLTSIPNIKIYGCLEELKKNKNKIIFPIVFKKAAGAMSKGIGIANNEAELLKKTSKISRTKNTFKELWEFGRSIKYNGYKKQSINRSKFILQNFIPNLDGDYKVLVFGDKFYVLRRGLKEGDFRASGSGIKYFIEEIPTGLLQFASKCIELINVPNISIDIAYDGDKFHLIEFQCLYFGSYTITYSKFYWKKNTDNSFDLIQQNSILEEEYASSIVSYIKANESSIYL